MHFRVELIVWFVFSFVLFCYCDRSSLGAEHDDLEQNKKFRMSELNGDYDINHSHLVNNSEYEHQQNMIRLKMKMIFSLEF